MKKRFSILIFISMILISCEDAAYYNIRIKNESTHTMILLKSIENWNEDLKQEHDSILISALTETDLSESGTQPDKGKLESFEMFDSIIIQDSESLYLNKSIKQISNWKLETDSRGLFNNICEYNYEFVISETDLTKKEK